MQTVPSVYAALILPDATGLDAAPYLEAARRALLRHDAKSGDAPVLCKRRGIAQGDSLTLRIQPDEFGDYGPCVRVILTPIAPYGLTAAQATRVLSETLRKALTFSEADFVEWGAPDRLLDVPEFQRACRAGSLGDLPNTAPDNMNERALGTLFRDPQDTLPLAPPSALTGRLMAHCDALRDKDPADLRLDASSWAMTGTVACIAPPIGATMTVLGLMRGFDFRRVTQALSLTAVFVLLQNQGAISQVAQTVLP